MENSAFVSMFYMFIPILVLFTPVAADFAPFPYCTNDTARNYVHNFPFETNLKLLLQSLPQKTSPTGFNNTFVGDFPHNIVYGQALCRGDVNSSVCQDCVQNASQNILTACQTLDAVLWYEFCQVHYSFQMFFSQNIYTGKYPKWNDLEKNVSQPVRFYKILMFLLNNLTGEAAFNSSRKMFATGEIKSPDNRTIYGLVQCTRDLSGADCYNCLSSAFGDLHACCYSREGGTILSRNCNVRFQMYSFYNASSNLLTYTPPKGEKWKTWMVVLAAFLTAVVVAILIGFCVVYKHQRKGKLKDEEIRQQALLQELASPKGVMVTEEGNLVSTEEMPFMDLSIIRAATDNFSDTNKLGYGGFGTVYKGVLPDGKEIAVKRLSRTSWQGLDEFKNEVILIAKLQHRNLVRLLGCSIEGEEKILIYEFMPNLSLDFFIFDSERRAQLNWEKCYDIIGGIARGLLYLHEDSRLKIIHRDLKPSNVLLDHEMVAKISDFGMARIFGENQNTANTKRVVGTYGYMAPEYAMAGLFSVKSDVFSFGVLLLEIISGKRNSGFYLTEQAPTLLAYVWKLWNDGKGEELGDRVLMETGPTEEVLRCIHIGLLCVQEDPADRPTMSTVVVLLESEAMALPPPNQPAFSVGRRMGGLDDSSTAHPSLNHITVSSIAPR